MDATKLTSIYFLLIMGTWCLASMSASGFNNVIYSYRTCSYEYEMGRYAHLSLELPAIISFILFLIPKKKKIPLSSIIMITTVYITSVILALFMFHRINADSLLLKWWIRIIIFVDACCILMLMIDCEKNIKKANDKLQSLHLGPPFLIRYDDVVLNKLKNKLKNKENDRATPRKRLRK